MSRSGAVAMATEHGVIQAQQWMRRERGAVDTSFRNGSAPGLNSTTTGTDVFHLSRRLGGSRSIGYWGVRWGLLRRRSHLGSLAELGLGVHEALRCRGSLSSHAMPTLTKTRERDLQR